MDKRHLLEEDQHHRALTEFTILQSMKDLVDWDLFKPVLEDVFGPPEPAAEDGGPGIIWSFSGAYCWV